MDITNKIELENYLRLNKPDYFIHAAAYTSANEKHEENPDKSISINIIGTCNIVLCLNVK